MKQSTGDRSIVSRTEFIERAKTNDFPPTPPLEAGVEYGQWVRAARDGFREVRVLVGTRGTTVGCRLEFGIKHDPADPEALRVVQADSRSVANNDYHPFAFPAIPDSAGRRYYAYLRSPDATAATGVVLWCRPAWDAEAAATVGGTPTGFAWRYLCRYGDAPPEDPADFQVIHAQFLRYVVEPCGLRPDGRVLDVGCGTGSWAVPLAGYLAPEGRYEGFDVNAEQIEWCRGGIGRRHPNFNFQCADIWNGRYNPGGRQRADEYRFPYADGSFDLVFLISVFTHLLPRDLEHYVAEIARVLRRGGQCLATFFLLNRESERLIRAGRSRYDFAHALGACRVADPATPEAVVGYEETFVRILYARHRLTLEPVDYGTWCGRESGLAHQDVTRAVRGR